MSATQSDAARRRESRECYERVLRVVDHQTGEPQLPMVRRGPIRSLLSRTSLDLDQANRAIRAAIANDDLLDHEGRLALVDEESLSEVLSWEAAKDEPSRELIAKCNRLLDGLREGR